jgi:hypothetical protein
MPQDFPRKITVLDTNGRALLGNAEVEELSSALAGFG